MQVHMEAKPLIWDKSATWTILECLARSGGGQAQITRDRSSPSPNPRCNPIQCANGASPKQIRCRQGPQGSPMGNSGGLPLPSKARPPRLAATGLSPPPPTHPLSPATGGGREKPRGRARLEPVRSSPPRMATPAAAEGVEGFPTHPPRTQPSRCPEPAKQPLHVSRPPPSPPTSWLCGTGLPPPASPSPRLLTVGSSGSI